MHDQPFLKSLLLHLLVLSALIFSYAHTRTAVLRSDDQYPNQLQAMTVDLNQIKSMPLKKVMPRVNPTATGIKRTKFHPRRATVKVQSDQKPSPRLNQPKRRRTASAEAAFAKALQAERTAKLKSLFASGEVNRYQAMILSRLAQNFRFPPGLNKHLSSQIVLTLDATGRVVDVVVLQSSGSDVLDRAAVAAAYNASPLPIPQSGVLKDAFKRITLNVSPKGFLEG